MDRTPFFRRAFRILRFRPDAKREVSEEIGFYLEERTAELIREGFSEEAARAEARRAFGDPDRISAEVERIRQTEIRKERRGMMIDELRRDLTFALRSFRKQPFFTGAVVGILALGIAGNAAMFSVVNALFLRPFPYPEPDRIVYLNETAPRWDLELVSITYPDFAAWRDQNGTFEDLGVWREGAGNLVSADGAARVVVTSTSWDMIPTLGLVPLVGRPYTPEEDVPGGPDVVMLVESFWRDHFGSDPEVIGQRITLDGSSLQIIGVLPEEAVISSESDLWRPLQVDPNERTSYSLNGMGRLKPGVTIPQAEQDLRRIQQGLIDDDKATDAVMPIVRDLRKMALGDFQTAVIALWGATLIFLLIACINVAGLILARSISRRREFGIRTAIGAGRGQIVRQMLTESAVYTFVGGLIGILLARAVTPVLRGMLPLDLPPWLDFPVDGRVLLLTLVVCGLAALLAGLIPALRSSDLSAAEVAGDGQRLSVGKGRRRLLGTFVVGEMALSLVLLVTVGLLVKTYRHLEEVDPGFDADGVISFRVALPQADYPEDEQIRAFFSAVLERLQGVPSVQKAAATTIAPMRGHSGYFFEVEGAAPRKEGDADPVILVRMTTAGYADAMGIRLKSGTWFTSERPSDGDETSYGIVVNETFVRQSFGDQDPLGRRIRPRGTPVWARVVGVSYDTRHYGLDQEMRPGVFVPMGVYPPTKITFVARTAGDPEDLVPTARSIIQELDPTLPIYEVQRISEIVSDSLGFRRAYSTLLGVFAMIALLLAMAGIYGVVSYTVSRRVREIGIRMALGADRRRVLWLVIRQGSVLVGLGALVGVGLSVLAASGIATLLYGMDALDPGTFLTVSALLAGMAMLANMVPAFRATRIAPSEALRLD